MLRLADVSMAPGERRRVGKLFGSPALTFFGLPETGPIFASHLSWYIDESIGIPISNAFVVPVDVGGLRGLRPPGALP
ncbi:MAG: hypothetical protein M5U19_08785 [Microthrixaceae bacterium]|nr:hypothetical protein [Microthrixaceae bacterium]